MARTEEEKLLNEVKKGNLKRKLLGVLIIIPILIFIYFYSKGGLVKRTTNNLLSKIPGPVGRYFKNTPTEAEKNERVDYLANYFLGLDEKSSADKLYIIKKEDEKLYNSIIKKMNTLDNEKTENIIVKVRDIDMRKDLLASVYDDAQEDERDRFLSEVSRIESQSLLESKLELERRFSSKEFQKMLEEIRPERLAEILYYTDTDISRYIIDGFRSKDRIKLESEIQKIAEEKENLIDLAKYYETKPKEDAIKVLTSEETYSVDKLATIFNNMSVFKSSRILSEVEDDLFIEELFRAIKTEEALTDSELNITRDISRSIEFLNDYNGKITKLRSVYGEMDPSHVAKITETMMENDSSITIFDIDLEDSYELSDKVIILDILSGVKKEKLSKVLDSMDSEKAGKLTQLLSTPEERIFKGGEKLDDEEITNEG